MAGSSKINLDGVTINRRIAESIAKFGTRPAISSKKGGNWSSITYAELGRLVEELSMGLRSHGINRGDRVAMISENRPEWAISDLAILAAGAVTVPIYSTLPVAQIVHILNDSGTKAVIASDSKQIAKIIAARPKCPALLLVVVMDESAVVEGTISFESVLAAGKIFEDGESFDERSASVHPADLASLVYTSGTTGDPKGAMLSHQNFAAAVGMAEVWFPVSDQERFLSFLPLCHVFERVTHFLSLSIGSHTYYAESIFKVQENLVEVRPTIMQSVPRLFETVYDKVTDSINKAKPRQKRIALWALRVGEAASTRTNSGKWIGPVLGVQKLIADWLVLSKVRARLGGNIKFFVSGGAPLSQSVAAFFHAIDAPILEGYGMTETTAPLTCNKYHRARIGTVGQAFPLVTLKIASDGEILAKGPDVMTGYWNNPGATHEMFDEEGWLQTGDIGEIDRDGYLHITDRKKDIIVLANGKNVAPQQIEALIKQSRYINEVVLFGDRAGSIAALILPNFDMLAQWARENKVEFSDARELSSRVEARKQIKKEVERFSGDLAEFEKIRKIALLTDSLTVENGELTPTLKVRRKVVFERFSSLLD